MQFEAHSDCRRHHLLQEVQVGEDPLVFGGDAEVAFEQGVEAVQEGLQAEDKQAGQRVNGEKERHESSMFNSRCFKKKLPHQVVRF